MHDNKHKILCEKMFLKYNFPWKYMVYISVWVTVEYNNVDLFFKGQCFFTHIHCHCQTVILVIVILSLSYCHCHTGSYLEIARCFDHSYSPACETRIPTQHTHHRGPLGK